MGTRAGGLALVGSVPRSNSSIVDMVSFVYNLWSCRRHWKKRCRLTFSQLIKMGAIILGKATLSVGLAMTEHIKKALMLI